MTIACCVKQGIAPGVLLALLPKCPLCVAALIAAALGAQISMTAAMLIRSMIVLLCTASIAFLLARSLPLIFRLRFGSRS